MTSTVSLAHPARRGKARGFRFGVAAGLVVPLVLLAAFSFVGDSGSRPAGVEGLSAEEASAQRDALRAFEEALAPVTETGASTVVYGMRPGIDDIHAERLDDETLTSMAAGWVQAMTEVREDFAAVEAPGFLEETVGLYREAFDTYLATAQSLRAAAQATGEERAGHISDAAEAGERADGLYDAAKAELAKHRERLGLVE